MRADLFGDRKCVHIKISKEVHFALRAKLFKHSISMQELFDEFARVVATDSPKGQFFVDAIVNKKIKNALEGKKKKRDLIGEFDSETLYSMINSPKEKNDKS
jgi:hypothetical protein